MRRMIKSALDIFEETALERRIEHMTETDVTSLLEMATQKTAKGEKNFSVKR